MNDHLNRRDFLHRSSLAPLVIGAGLGLATRPPTAVAAKPIPRAGGPKLKTSLNAFSFNKQLLDQLQGIGPGITLLELLDFCAEHNFDAIDPTGYYFPGYPKPPTDDFLYAFKRRAHQLGLEVSGTGVRNDFAQKDGALRAAAVQHVREWVEVAAKLGAPVLRVFAGQLPAGDAWDAAASRCADDLRQCVEFGKQHGVLIGVQNHGDLLKTSDDVLKLVERVDSDWLGVVVDTGSFKTEDPYVDVAKVMPYAVNFQVKESPFGKESPVRTDLPRLVKIIRDANYRGYLPIETLMLADRPYNPQELVPKFLAELRAALDQPSS